MASSVRRLCLDATLGRYWRIGPLFGWTSESAEFPCRRSPRNGLLGLRSSLSRPTACSPLPAIVIVRLMLASAPMTFSRQPVLLRSTSHRPVLARSHSLKAFSSLLLSSRAC
jgi:hypothetical protein